MTENDSGWRKRQIALDKKAENARELGLDYEPEFIYTTFKQWAEGQFLETGEPRKQAYSKDELALIEMGWSYGCDAGRLAEREACAKVCEGLRKKEIAHWNAYGMDGSYYSASDCAKAIRARGQA